MKRIYLLLLLLTGLALSASAQKIRFTDPTNQWVVFNDGGGTDYYQNLITYHLKGDTVLQGRPYKRLYATVAHIYVTPGTIPSGTTGYTGFYFREDTVTQRVYGYRPGDTAETMVYSPSWHAGDTMLPRCGTNSRYYIGSVDTVGVGVQKYPVFHFRPVGGPAMDAYDVIEGYGSTAGPWFPMLPCLGVEIDWKLRCFHNGGGTQPIHPALNTRVLTASTFDNAVSCALSVNEESLSQQHISIAPLPATAHSVLQLSTMMQRGSIAIYTGTGAILYSGALEMTDHFAIGKYITVPGVYLYQVKDLQRGAAYSGRFVFQ